MSSKVIAFLIFIICVTQGIANSGTNYQTYARGINIVTNVLKFTDSNTTNSGVEFADGTFLYTNPTNVDYMKIGTVNVVRVNVTNLFFPDGTSFTTAVANASTFTLLTSNISYSIQFTGTNDVYFTNGAVASHYCLEKGYVFIDRTNMYRWPVDQWAHFRLYSSTTKTYDTTIAEYMDKRITAQRVATTAVTVGTKNITVDDSSVFNVDDPVVICYTNGTYQLNKITDKISNTLYFQDGTTINIPANSTNNTINSVFMLGNLNLYDTSGFTNLYGRFEFDATNLFTGVIKFIYQERN